MVGMEVTGASSDTVGQLRDSIQWGIGPDAITANDGLRVLLGPTTFNATRNAFRQFLSAYFHSEAQCKKEQGASISPLAGGATGWKRLKVRWRYPGAGKSGGLRVLVSVNCAERRVILSRIEDRRSL
ncbi:MAG: hypothetical protein GC161_18200 [Planctomycetaceae bacterium]|nr:hypothetical protein [Planctomycetaceae bacterium]